MAFNLVEEIRKKSREEWVQLPKEKVTEARIWIQENPEKAFLAGLAAGVVVVAAFKAVVWIIVLALLCFVAILAIAHPAGIAPGGSGPEEHYESHRTEDQPDSDSDYSDDKEP